MEIINQDKIDLLSVKEYKAAEDNIPPLNEYWWLHSPGNDSLDTACVTPCGDIHDYGHSVFVNHVGVRPVIRINPRSVNLQIGEKAQCGGRTFTYIAEGILLCDEIICKMPFRKDWQADDVNDYETSDVKMFLDEWLNKAMSECGKGQELSQQEKFRIYYEQAHSLHMQDAKKRVINYIKAKGYDPDSWLDKFDIDILATMFEERRGCNVTDNDTWLVVFRHYIDEHEIPIRYENIYDAYFTVEGRLCVKMKATSEENAKEKAIIRIRDIINLMDNKDFDDLRNMGWHITDTQLIKLPIKEMPDHQANKIH